MKELSLREVQARAKAGPILLLGRRGVALLIGLASTFTIARLLSPRDYGLAAMATVILAFAQTFRDFGLTNATLRKGHIDQSELSFLFWFNVAATLGLAIVIGIASPFIARFYGEPAVQMIVIAALAGFVIDGCALQHNAIMRRDLRFGWVAAVDTLAILAGFIVGLAIAFVRRDYWAIVAVGLTQAIVSSTLNIAITRWRPGRPAMISGAADLFRFGINSTLYSMLNFASRYSSTVLIGHGLGSVSLGHFNRAYDLYQLPFNNLLRPIAQSTLPVMTRLRQTPDLYRINYLAWVERLSCALIPPCVVLAFSGKPLVELLLGSQWSLAGQLLEILAPALAVYGVIYPISDLLISQDRAGALRTVGITDFLLRAGGVAVGVYCFGIAAAALGFTIATLLMMPVRILIAGRHGPVSAWDQFRATLPAVPIGVMVGVGCGAAKQVAALYPAGPVWTLTLLGMGGFIGFILSLALFRRSRIAMSGVIAMLTGKYKIVIESPERGAESDGTSKVTEPTQ